MYILEHSRGVAKLGSFKFGTIERLRRARDGAVQRAEQFRIEVSAFFSDNNEREERETEKARRAVQ